MAAWTKPRSTYLPKEEIIICTAAGNIEIES
jgi:hypothetical protein